MRKLRKILCLCLAFAMLLTSTVVYADTKYNGGEQGGVASGKKTVKDGPSCKKCGIILYAINKKTGKKLGGSARLLCSNPPKLTTVITSRLGNINWHDGYSRTDTSFPSPVKEENGEWNSNGDAVRSWLCKMYTYSGRTKPKYEWAITDVEVMTDSEYAEWKAHKTDYVVVVEPIMWSRVYDANGNNYHNDYLMGTAYIWAALNHSTLHLDAGAPLIRRFTHNAIQNSMVLKETWFGLEPPVKKGYVTWSDIYSHGYGLHIIEIDNTDPPYSTKTPTPSASEKADGDFSIIKVYEDLDMENIEEQTYVHKASYIQNNAPNSNIYVESEPEYTVCEWTSVKEKIDTVDESNTYESIVSGKSEVQHGTGDGLIEIGDTEKTLVVRLRNAGNITVTPDEQEIDGDKKITQSKITQSFSDEASGSLKFMSEKASGYGTSFTKTVPDTKADGTKGTKTVHCCNAKESVVTDSDFNMKMVNGNIDTSLMVNSSKFPMFYSVEKATRDSSFSFVKYLNSARYTYDLSRLADDKLTLCDYSKDVAGYTDNNSDIKSLVGISSNVPSSTRKAENYEKGLKYTLNQDTGTDTMTESHWKGCSDSHSTDSCQLPVNCSDTVKGDYTVEIKAYSGKEKAAGNKNGSSYNWGSGDEEGSAPPNMVNDNVYGTTLGGNTPVKFYPFVQMQYNKATNLSSYAVNDGNVNGETKQAYVLSQFERSFTPVDYMQTSWKYSPDNNLKIISNQFSSHARATQGTEAWNGQFVLPGGATYDLEDVDKSSPQTVNVTTIHTLIDGTMKNVKTSGGDECTEERAKQEFIDAVNGTIDSLDALNLAQYVNTNYERKAWNGGQIVERGGELNLDNGSNTSSSDEKYYLDQSTEDDRDTSRNAISDGDIDLKYPNTGTNKYFGVYAGTDGNIYLTQAQSSKSAAMTASGVAVIKKGENVSKLTDPTAQYLDTRTKIFTNLDKCLERNTGNDTNAQNVSDGKWYNEATPRIVLLVQSVNIQCYLINATHRVTVLDPKLCPMNSGVSDLFRNAFVMQYRCYPYSHIHEGQNDYLTTIRGKDLNLVNMENLLYSNKIYIPNATVKDLLTY